MRKGISLLNLNIASIQLILISFNTLDTDVTLIHRSTLTRRNEYE